MEFRIVPKDQWQSIDKATNCQFADCGQKLPSKFDLFGGFSNKPANCNICGIVCCKNCLGSHEVKLPPRIPDPVPACPRCRNLVNAYIERQNAKALKNAAGIEAERVRQISNESFAADRKAHDLEIQGLKQKDSDEMSRRVSELEQNHQDMIKRVIEKYEGKLALLRQEIDQNGADHLEQLQGMKQSYEERIQHLSSSGLTPYGSPTAGGASSPASNASSRLSELQKQEIEDAFLQRICASDEKWDKKVRSLEVELDETKMRIKEKEKALEDSQVENNSMKAHLSENDAQIERLKKKLADSVADAEGRNVQLQLQISDLMKQQQQQQQLQQETSAKNSQQEEELITTMRKQFEARDQQQQDKLQDLENELQKLVKENEQLRNEKDQCASLADRLSLKFEAELKATQHSKEVAENEVSRLKSEAIPNLQRQHDEEKTSRQEEHQTLLNDLMRQLSEITSKSEESTNLIDQLREEKQNLQSQLEQSDCEKGALLEEISQLQTATIPQLQTKFETEKSALQENFERRLSELNQKHEMEIGTINSSNSEKLENEKSAIELKFQTLLENEQSVSAEKQHQLASEISELTQRLDSARTSAAASYSAISRQVEFLQTENESRQQTIDQLEEHLKKLESEKDSERMEFEEEKEVLEQEIVSRKSELETLKMSHQSEISQLVEKSRSETALLRTSLENESMTKLSDARSDFEARLEARISEHEQQIETLQETFAQTQSETSRQHQRELQSTSESHDLLVSVLKSDHAQDLQRQLSQQKSDHESFVESQKQNHQQEMTNQTEEAQTRLSKELDEKLNALRLELLDDKDRCVTEMVEEIKILHGEHTILINKVAAQQRRMWRLEDAILKKGGKVPPVADDEDVGSQGKQQ